jgi:hypothetical protein
VSYDYAVKVPAHAVQYSKEDNKTVYFATLLAPFKNQARKYQAEVVNEKTYRIADDDGSYLILFSDGKETKQGDFEFDGEVLCARFDRRGSLKSCAGAQTSSIKYQGKTLLDSVKRAKIDAGECTP